MAKYDKVAMAEMCISLYLVVSYATSVLGHMKLQLSSRSKFNRLSFIYVIDAQAQ